MSHDSLSLPICTRPWTRLYVTADGNCWNCCYQVKPFHSISDNEQKKFEEVWNNEKIQSIRASLLDGKLPTEFCDCINKAGGIPPPDAEPDIEFRQEQFVEGDLNISNQKPDGY